MYFYFCPACDVYLTCCSPPRGCSLSFHSDVLQSHHRALLVPYFDLTVRYCAILVAPGQQHRLQRVLEALCGEGGMHHANPTVRSRACYSLMRLCKTLKRGMLPFVDAILGGIQPFMAIPLGLFATRNSNCLVVYIWHFFGTMQIQDRQLG